MVALLKLPVRLTHPPTPSQEVTEVPVLLTVNPNLAVTAASLLTAPLLISVVIVVLPPLLNADRIAVPTLFAGITLNRPATLAT